MTAKLDLSNPKHVALQEFLEKWDRQTNSALKGRARLDQTLAAVEVMIDPIYAAPGESLKEVAEDYVLTTWPKKYKR